MTTRQKFNLNPLKIIGVWTVLMILLTPLSMYTSNTGASGGEQRPFTILATMIIATIIGITSISIATPFIFRNWIKTNRWFYAIIILLTIPTSFFLWQYFFETPYSYVETTTKNGGNKIETKTEYYDEDSKLVRSTSYWKNDKRDSSWTIYAKDGRIISQKVYRNDSLIYKK